VESTLLTKAAEYGFVGLLFVGLLLWVLRTSWDREQRLTGFIEKFVPLMQKISDDLAGVCREVGDIRRDVELARRAEHDKAA